MGGDRVRVVDTETASLAMGLLALAIQRRLARGTTDEEVEALIERFKEENGVVFTVSTLEYLQKGGRIGRAAALAGAILNVKPILSVDDGVVHPIGKVRGRQKALEEFARVFTSSTEDVPGLRVAIAHADAPEWVEVLTDLVAKARPQARDRARREPRRGRRDARRPRRGRLLLVPGRVASRRWSPSASGGDGVVVAGLEPCRRPSRPERASCVSRRTPPAG